MKQSQRFDSGRFFIGCNYWASHAGMRMWSRWDEDIVSDDLRRLAEYGVDTLRVFPLWSEFQPLRMHYGGGGIPREIRRGEAPLGYDDVGRAGIDPEMLARFLRFCDLAQARGIRLIVGLLTGWMSGRLFVPEMLQGRDVLTDPLAIEWEIRFVRCMVHRIADHPAVMAWDLGNECNCMGRVDSAEAAYCWTAAISMAIRMEDPRRPIVSGMHGLSPNGYWRMQDQGELLDVLCTHPYPIFTPHCDTDPLNGMKNPMHAPAESLYYGDIGGKPCFAEETGTLGPMEISDTLGADYLRMTLFNLLANDCRGLLWWCGFEQSALDFPPYDWNGVERELGLFYLDKTPKPVLLELKRFSDFLKALPFDRLPARRDRAVCVLTRGQDSWAAAYGAFILAAQAGFSLRFAWADDEIPEGDAYLLPDLEGDASLARRVMLEILDRVRRGALLYLSLDGAMMSPFSSFTGLRVLSRAHHAQSTAVDFDGASICVSREFRLQMESVGAQVLARTADGEIAFARNDYGEGQVYTMAFPIEKMIATQPGVVNDTENYGCFRFYRCIHPWRDGQRVRINRPTIAVSEHILSDCARIVILVNCEPKPAEEQLGIPEGWAVEAQFPYHPGDGVEGNTLRVGPNSAVVLVLAACAG